MILFWMGFATGLTAAAIAYIYLEELYRPPVARQSETSFNADGRVVAFRDGN